MYQQDAGKNLTYSGGNSLWMERLMSYYGNTHKIRSCPVAFRESVKRVSKPSQALQEYGTVDEGWIWPAPGTNFFGSYAFNGWFYFDSPIGDSQKEFKTETAVQNASLTPVFGDAIWVDAWPLATDPPARNLYEGWGYPPEGMGRYCIARHGSRPAAVPRKLVSGDKLVGGIVVSLADGHAELVLLERLWDLYWHKNYNPPAQRPK
jgi:hypothetical protein